MNDTTYSFPISDPIWQQHMIWFLSQPSVWLVIAKCLLVFVGIFMIAHKLYKSKHFVWLVVFLIAIIIGMFGFYGLFQQSFQLVKEGHYHQIIMLRFIGFFLNIFALLVAIRLVYLAFFKKKSNA